MFLYDFFRLCNMSWLFEAILYVTFKIRRLTIQIYSIGLPPAVYGISAGLPVNYKCLLSAMAQIQKRIYDSLS